LSLDICIFTHSSVVVHPGRSIRLYQSHIAIFSQHAVFSAHLSVQTGVDFWLS